MSTSSPILKTTNPKYATSSTIMLEVKFPNDVNWSKLKDSEPYAHNRDVSFENQVKQLESTRDNWILNGPKKYFSAEYRIGRYEHQTGSEYAFVSAHILLERLK